MRTRLIIYNSPFNIIASTPSFADVAKRMFFEIRNYDTEMEALDAYANTRCVWSKLMEDDADYEKFIDEAYEHIINHDDEWLEENFT